MSTLKELCKSPLIHVALTTGICIIILAFSSKRILPEPIGFAQMAIPAFLMSIHSTFFQRNKDHPLWQSKYWVLLILFVTIVIILINH